VVLSGTGAARAGSRGRRDPPEPLPVGILGRVGVLSSPSSIIRPLRCPPGRSARDAAALQSTRSGGMSSTPPGGHHHHSVLGERMRDGRMPLRVEDAPITVPSVQRGCRPSQAPSAAVVLVRRPWSSSLMYPCPRQGFREHQRTAGSSGPHHQDASTFSKTAGSSSALATRHIFLEMSPSSADGRTTRARLAFDIAPGGQLISPLCADNRRGFAAAHTGRVRGNAVQTSATPIPPGIVTRELPRLVRREHTLLTRVVAVELGR